MMFLYLNFFFLANHTLKWSLPSVRRLPEVFIMNIRKQFLDVLTTSSSQRRIEERLSFAFRLTVSELEVSVHLCVV